MLRALRRVATRPVSPRRPASQASAPKAPDIPPPPPEKPNFVLPVFIATFVAGGAWIYMQDPDEEDKLEKVPQFLEDIRPVQVPPREEAAPAR
jgi:hypothetical protein